MNEWKRIQMDMMMPRFVATFFFFFLLKIAKKNRTKSGWFCTKRAILHSVCKTCPVRRRYSSEVLCVLFSVQFSFRLLLDVSSVKWLLLCFKLNVSHVKWLNEQLMLRGFSAYLHIRTFSNIVKRHAQSWVVFFCTPSSLWILWNSKMLLLLFICWRSHLFVCGVAISLLSIAYGNKSWRKIPIHECFCIKKWVASSPAEKRFKAIFKHLLNISVIHRLNFICYKGNSANIFIYQLLMRFFHSPLFNMLTVCE